MDEALEGIPTKEEAVQLGEDIRRKGAPAFLQGHPQFREFLAYQAVEEVIVGPPKLRGHGALMRGFFRWWNLFGEHGRFLVLGPRKVPG